MALELYTAALNGEPSIGFLLKLIWITCSPISAGTYLALIELPSTEVFTGTRPLGPELQKTQKNCVSS